MFYEGRSAVVLGGSQGIGRAVAIGLARRGCHVVVGARRPEPLAEALERVREARRGPDQRAGSLTVDVTDPAALAEAFRQVASDQGVPDLLINCAGYARPGYLQDLSPEHLRDLVTCNYLGTAYACQAMLPHFLARGSGHFVNTSSLLGLFGLFGYTGYCGSKSAVIGFSEALRREVRPHGLRVSVLCPPNTRTPGLDEENRYKPPEVLAAEEKVKVLEPEEVAEPLLRALPKAPFLVIPTADGWAAHLLNRFAPWLLELFVRRPDPS